MTFTFTGSANTAALMRICMLVLLLVCIVAFAGSVLPVLSIFAVGAIGAYLLNPIVNLLREKLRFPKSIAIFAVMALLLGLVGILMRSVIPPLYNQISSLVENLPVYRQSALDLLSRLLMQAKDGSLSKLVLDTLHSAVQGNSIDFSSILTQIALALISFPSKLFQVFLTLVTLVYFLACEEDLYHSFVRQFTPHSREVVCRILSKCNKVAWRYLKARVLVSCIMAVATFIGFSIFRLDYALLLALLAFVLDFVPYFGSITAGVVAGVVMLLTQGFVPAVYLGIFILCVQQIECNVLAPRIEGGSMGISPIIILFAIFACNHLFGFMGMLLATPLTCIVKILLEEFRAYYIFLSQQT